MLDLPKSTEVNRLVPKEKLIKKLNLSPALKTSLKDKVRKVAVTNELSHKTMNIIRGKDVWAVFVVEIQLKQKDADYKLVEALGKQIRQKIVFVLRYENLGQLALYRGRLYHSDWTNYEELTLEISGADLDAIWNGIVMRLALDERFEENTDVINDSGGVDELLQKQEQRKKLEREIAALEKKMRSEKQPRRKLEISDKVKRLKIELERG